MPELPEVTTMVRGLQNKVLKRTIVDVWTDSEKNIKKPKDFKDFKDSLIRAEIRSIKRKGKLILFYFDNEKVLIVHPKMSGHFLFGQWEKKKGEWKPLMKGNLEDPMNRYIHLIFFLDNSEMLAFSDLRKFARIELWDRKDLDKADILQVVGPDALEISLEEFEKGLKENKKKIKQVLMNQSFISGIGNIYSDEILFRAGISPLREAKSLKKKEVENLYSSIKPIFKKAIEFSGSSISDFRKIDGSKGDFQNLAKVYGKEGKECPNCKTKIKRVKIGGRSVHYCPKCQK